MTIKFISIISFLTGLWQLWKAVMVSYASRLDPVMVSAVNQIEPGIWDIALLTNITNYLAGVMLIFWPILYKKKRV